MILFNIKQLRIPKIYRITVINNSQTIIQTIKLSRMLSIELQTFDKHQQITKYSTAGNQHTNESQFARNETLPDLKKDDGQPKVRLKNTKRKIIVGLIISLSALMFGYSMKEITSVPITVIIEQYHITISKFAAQSILIGILPISAVLGVIITKFLITRYRRLTGIYIFTFVNIGAIVLVNITTFGTLLAGRCIQGICVGYYTTIAPIYLKEIAPKELRRMLGLFFSFGKIVGVLVAIILQLIFQHEHFEYSWRIILSLTALFSTLQAILLFFFGSDTPAEMIEKGKEAEAMQIIQRFYKEEYVKQVFNEYKQEWEAEIAKGIETRSEDLNGQKQKELRKSKKIGYEITETINYIQSEPNVPTMSKMKRYEQTVEDINDEPKKEKKEEVVTFDQKKNKAYWLGIHLCIIRHFTGGNAIITQGGLFITSINKSLGQYTSIIINSIQFIFVVIGLIYIQKITGKRPLFLISITCLSFLNIGLAISMIYSNVMVCEFIMCVYMAVYGGSFISPIWSYPSEIIPASQALGPNIVHWLALAISTLVPPVVTGIMPHNNAYPVFLFFGLYGFIGVVHVFSTMKESDGKSYNQIIKSFK